MPILKRMNTLNSKNNSERAADESKVEEDENN